MAASQVSGQPADQGQKPGRVADGDRAASPPEQLVSVDLLRHPITAKVRQRLQTVLEKMESGDHESAIALLVETLAKYPDSAPYVQILLGVEYVKTDQFTAAISSFEQAVSLLPHDAMTHYNFGLALVCAGDYDRAEQQFRRALELDPKNKGMQAKLNALLERKRSAIREARKSANDPDQK